MRSADVFEFFLVPSAPPRAQFHERLIALVIGWWIRLAWHDEYIRYGRRCRTINRQGPFSLEYKPCSAALAGRSPGGMGLLFRRVGAGSLESGFGLAARLWR